MWISFRLECVRTSPSPLQNSMRAVAGTLEQLSANTREGPSPVFSYGKRSMFCTDAFGDFHQPDGVQQILRSCSRLRVSQRCLLIHALHLNDPLDLVLHLSVYVLHGLGPQPVSEMASNPRSKPQSSGLGRRVRTGPPVGRNGGRTSHSLFDSLDYMLIIAH